MDRKDEKTIQNRSQADSVTDESKEEQLDSLRETSYNATDEGDLKEDDNVVPKIEHEKLRILLRAGRS